MKNKLVQIESCQFEAADQGLVVIDQEFALLGIVSWRW